MNAPASHLLALLQIGTSRATGARTASLAPELAAALPPAGPDDIPEQQLWLALGASALWQRAGQQPGVATAMPSAAVPEQLRPCPDAAATLLARLLQGKQDIRLVGEWLRSLQRTGGHLPARLLPNLLALATRHAALRDDVAAVLGERGHWLAGLESGWQWAHASAGDNDPLALWETGTPEQRRGALAAWRRRDPAAARDALAQGWASEASEQRAALLGCLLDGLGPDDEAFLDAALDDRRKEVRSMAQALLARLPGSGLAQRMRARVEPLLAVKRSFLGRTSIEVTLPDTLDKAWKRDGVGASTQHGLGEKAGWLADLLSATDPRLWCARFGMTPHECLQAAERSEFDHALIRGWAAAPLHAGVPVRELAGWNEALLLFWLTTTDPLRHQYANDFFELFAHMPADALHAFLGRLLSARRASAEQEQRLIALLEHAARRAPVTWLPDLSRAAVERVLGERASQPTHAWLTRNSLAALAFVVDAGAVLPLEAGWRARTADGAVDDAGAAFFDTVRLRHALSLSFQEIA